MTKEKFMALQQELQESSKPLMSYLQDAGVSYSTYTYWRRKLEHDSSPQPGMAPISQSSEIGKAVTYAYTRWDNMMHYLEDGRLLLDNNLAENEIRPITLGRKRLWSLCYAFS